MSDRQCLREIRITLNIFPSTMFSFCSTSLSESKINAKREKLLWVNTIEFIEQLKKIFKKYFPTTIFQKWWKQRIKLQNLFKTCSKAKYNLHPEKKKLSIFPKTEVVYCDNGRSLNSKAIRAILKCPFSIEIVLIYTEPQLDR